jgi:intracellular sulfur oxidation DsrE/DsrF family protein
MNDQIKKETLDLNALVDRELGTEERERILSDVDKDAMLRQNLSDLYHLKEMVRSAYSEEKGYTTRNPSNWLGRGGAIAASVMLLAAVFAGGYQAGSGAGIYGPATDVFHLAQASTADPGRVMLYVSSDEGGKFKQTLDQAQTYLDRFRNKGISVIVVASADGTDLFRKSVTPFEERINNLKVRYGESVDFIACNNAITRLRNQGADADLVKAVEVAPSAVQYVVDRLREGWTYVAI